MTSSRKIRQLKDREYWQLNKFPLGVAQRKKEKLKGTNLLYSKNLNIGFRLSKAIEQFLQVVSGGCYKHKLMSRLFSFGITSLHAIVVE